MTFEERQEALKYLKHGDLMLISKKSGFDPTVISRWIHGKLKKSGCAPYFEALVEKRKAEVKAINFDED